MIDQTALDLISAILDDLDRIQAQTPEAAAWIERIRQRLRQLDVLATADFLEREAARCR